MGRTRLSFWLTRFFESLSRKPAYAFNRAMSVERLDDRRQPSATPFGMEATMFGPPMHFRASEGLSDPRTGFFPPERNLFAAANRLSFLSPATDHGFGNGYFCGTPWDATPVDETETSTEATHFSVRLISDGYTGETSRLVVTALDASNRPVRDYTGTVQLTSSDPNLVLPERYTLTAADRGTHLFEIEPTTAGELTITATEVTPETPTEEPVTSEIDTAEVDTVLETGEDGAATTAVSDESTSVETTDAIIEESTTEDVIAEETPTTDDPSIETNIDDPLPEETASEEVTTEETSETTEPIVTDTTPEVTDTTPTVTEVTPVEELVDTPAEDTVDDGTTDDVAEETTPETPVVDSTPAEETETPVSGSITFDVVEAPDATHFLIRTLPRVFDGEPTKFLVVALDASNRVVPNYNGTVTFASTDGDSTMPAEYTFTDADYGTHIFSAQFETTGSQKITVTEKGSEGVVGTVAVDVVTPSAATTDTIGRRLWRRWSRF